MESDFADRFFWARNHPEHGKGVGAPTISKKVGCSPGLISNIENHGSKGTRLNDKFARLFRVDPAWLRDGSGPAPKGFSAAEAKNMRQHGPQSRRGEVVNLDDHRDPPRWAASSGDALADTEDRAAALQKRIFGDFQDYASLVGRERAAAMVEVLTRLSALVQPTAEKPQRDND